VGIGYHTGVDDCITRQYNSGQGIEYSKVKKLGSTYRKSRGWVYNEFFETMLSCTFPCVSVDNSNETVLRLIRMP
jgi:hypothetical protein